MCTDFFSFFAHFSTFGKAVGRLSSISIAAAFSITLSLAPRSNAAEPAAVFTRDVAPLFYSHCAECHRPGQGAPFSLLTYADARKHANDIVKAIESRFMPPWPPTPGFGDLEHARSLSDEQIGLFRRWVDSGMAEGVAGDLPSWPVWIEGWKLGKPDLVVTLSKAYQLAPEGPDIYRNFVIRVPLEKARYVRAVEFQPGNAACVHHAFVKLARTSAARRRDGLEAQPGFGGLMLPAGIEMPEGHFLTWQPGKIATLEDPRMAWRLEPGNDLVLQLHLRPTGKTESVQPSVALYFSDQVPDLTPFKFGLSTFLIELPGGVADTVIRDQWELPAGLRLLRVLPHAHYLGRDLQGYATLPDGSKRWLIRIRDWDFNWQGDYVYAHPIELPAGTVISMEYHYDNSTNNVRNPNHPPRQVSYGPGSTDEMAELWFQSLPLETNSLPSLRRVYNQKITKISREYAQHRATADSKNVQARVELSKIFLSEGNRKLARQTLDEALAAKNDDADALYMMGVLLRLENHLPEARQEFEKALRSNPEHGKAHGNLGLVLAGLGELDQAEHHLKEALRIDAEDSLARSALEELREARAEQKRGPK